MKAVKITKKESLASLINKYYENKDVNSLRKLFKRTKFNFINDALIEIDKPEVALFLLMAVEVNKASTIYRYLPDELQDKIVDIATNTQIKIIFSELYPDEIFDIADRNDRVNFKKIFLNLSSEKRNLLKKLDKFKHDEAGSFMNPDFISFNAEWSVNKCLGVVRKNFKKIEEHLVMFVTSSSGLLLGQISLHDLFFCKNYKAKISSIMSESFLSVKTNDDEFEHNFLSRDIYNGNSKFVKNFFIRLSREKNEDKINFKNYSVEHIMPQELKKWIDDGFVDFNTDEVERLKHTIGNLTITPYNSKYSNSTFKDKQYLMGESESFVINNYFIKNPDLTVWNTSEITKRSKILLTVVNNIWSLNSYKEVTLLKQQDLNEDNYQELANIISAKLVDKKLTYDAICMALNSYLVKNKSSSNCRKPKTRKESLKWQESGQFCTSDPYLDRMISNRKP